MGDEPMLLEILVFLILGVLAGTFTGLFPGIHINLIGAAVASGAVSFLIGINAMYLAVFIVAMSVAHIFLDFIPSILLGAAEEGTELSVLPGHELLKQGLGFQAVQLASLGCFYGIFIFLILIFPLYFITLFLTDLPRTIIALGLIAISANMIFLENKKASAVVVFLLTGILGYIVFNLDLKEPLLPLLTGLFGTASLFLSVRQKPKIAKQKTTEKITIMKTRPLLAAAVFSPLSFFLPALSSGQIAIISNQFVRADKKQFLFMLGTITMATMCLSFLGFFLISKTRTGSAVAIKDLLGILDWQIFIVLCAVMVLAGLASFISVSLFARKFVSLLEKVDYSLISKITIATIVFVVFLVSGLLGLLVLAVATATGVYCISLGVSRTNMIGCLLLPTILIYLF